MQYSAETTIFYVKHEEKKRREEKEVDLKRHNNKQSININQNNSIKVNCLFFSHTEKIWKLWSLFGKNLLSTSFFSQESAREI